MGVSPRAGFARLALVGSVIFLANAGLLVLQLVAGRLLAPFVGSSLETWTAVIGAFLTGIAVGNAVGGRAADRGPAPWKLAAFAALGGVGALWMMALPLLLQATELHRAIPLGVRIPVLATALCFPPAFVLSLLTPLAIKLGLPDVNRTGRVAGLIFSLGTLGCLVGNYAAGFYLIPHLTINALTTAAAGLLFVTALAALLIPKNADAQAENVTESAGEAPVTTRAPLSLTRAYSVVFLASFAGMAIELTASRLIAQTFGVSLFTWTAVIGVMLAGTAVGNWVGGHLADRAARLGGPGAGAWQLAACLILAGVAILVMLLTYFAGTYYDPLKGWGMITQIFIWSGVLFYAPMMFLGTISPQVIRLAIPDAAHAGRVAGRVYAWSTVGAIVGTFATGYLLISTVGMYRTVLAAAVLPIVATGAVCRVWERGAYLYTISIVCGAAVGGYILTVPSNLHIAKETNYYTIRVQGDLHEEGVLVLILDALIHSKVNPLDPSYIHYVHEQAQIEFLRVIADAHPDEQRVLVIGGGGYTFPRYARTFLKNSKIDVVEIDPGVTKVAYDDLALDPALNITTVNMDGRQFVAEKAPRGHYHLMTLDAVNDLTVPYHLLTKEFNDEAKAALAPDGVYLLTVIDLLEDGQLWKAAYHTLKKTFAHVELLVLNDNYDPYERQVYVLYAADAPFDLEKMRTLLRRQKVEQVHTKLPPPGELDRLLGLTAPVVLTDQFAPVDNMMAEVFRRRESSR
ncbi:fused MFS/spermidine synthase [Fimbriiglobus ruber]|uniref:Spermidine synthase-like protein n=1 Tax=Fimbriiglobus ruber TaxID=1908690 RepID=A0A225DX65_9BACT|nr:fused MFS/spermidine synthase [Fimbriiglobus ruber]OWK41789.1 Spermidine synthase-like protein [Fimbriiglobus ruber]